MSQAVRWAPRSLIVYLSSVPAFFKDPIGTVSSYF